MHADESTGEDATGDPPASSLWDRLDVIDAEITGVIGRLIRVETGIEELRSDLDDFEVRAAEIAAQAPPGAGQTPDPAGPQTLDMRVLVPWVRENLALVLQRKIPQTSAPHWCRQWWQHPEAIVRLEALRRAWSVAVHEPGAGMSSYLLQVDQHLAVLMGEHGPFVGCTGGQHKPDSQARYLGQDDPTAEFYLAVEQATAGPGPPVPS